MANQIEVIVADDSKIIRGFIKESLEGWGYTVAAEADSADGVSSILDRGTMFAIAILDNSMPHDGDGKRAAALVRLVRPDVKIVSLSSDRQLWGDENVEKEEGPDGLRKALERLEKSTPRG